MQIHSHYKPCFLIGQELMKVHLPLENGFAILLNED